MGNNQNIRSNFTELIFENRNKSYGAYILRVNYDRNITIAFFACMSFLVLIFAIPALIQFFNRTDTRPTHTIVEPPIIVIDDYSQKIEEIKPPARVIPPSTTTPFKSDYVVPTDKPIIETKTTDEDNTTDATKNVIQGPPTGPITPIETGGSITPPPAGPERLVDELPAFPGGMEKMYDYLRNNIRYPEDAKINGTHGQVFLSFVVGVDGSIKDIQVLKGIGDGCDEETVRVLKKMPKWTPGMLNGKKVETYYSMPITFEMNQD